MTNVWDGWLNVWFGLLVVVFALFGFHDVKCSEALAPHPSFVAPHGVLAAFAQKGVSVGVRALGVRVGYP